MKRTPNMVATISLPGRKPYLPGVFILASLLLSVTFMSCSQRSNIDGSDEVVSSGEVNLVWESWSLIMDFYVEGDSLDSEEATGNAVIGMLQAAEKSAYPFLTELDSVSAKPSADVPGELTDVWRAWVLLNEKWPDVDNKLLADAAVQGLVKTIGDDSAVHLNPESYDRARERLKGSYYGIGASVATQDGKMVLLPMNGSPAENAGVEAGDIVLEVDQEQVEGKSFQEVIERVRGPVGTRVTLLIERADEEEPLEINVIRGDINVESVDRRLLPGAIGHIFISDFQETTPDEILDTLEELQQVDMLALILDLRSNFGGSTESAQKVASQFLPDGLFMYEVDRDGQRTDWHIQEGGTATEGFPMVVMVNEFTSGVAEALAGSLQDAGRATILGKTSLGQGSKNVFKELSDGSAIYIPVSYWYTPSGNPIKGVGIEPDIEVDLTEEDRAFGIDTQLTEAYDYLDSLLPSFR